MTQELIERLRHSVVIRKGETIVLDMGDGPKPVSSGDVVQLRNPDGPEAADALQSQSARIAELEGAWQLIDESAPHACHVLAARFDDSFGEWIYGIVLSPPSKPFTHWKPLPEPPPISLTKDSTSG